MLRSSRVHLWLVALGALVLLGSTAAVAAELSASGTPAVTPAVVTDTWVKHGVKNDTVTILANTWTTVARLSLPAGRYAVSASLTVGNPLSGTKGIVCRLTFGGRTHKSQVYPADRLSDPMTLQTAGTSAIKSNAVLQCSSVDADGAALWIRITAVAAGTLNIVNM